MKDYAKKAQLKGFRPGKVPTGVIRKMFGKSILVDEINDLINKNISTYIRENNLRILGDPLPNREKAGSIDWDNQTDFEFEYQIGMVEDFTYDLSSKIKVKSYQIELKESVVEESVNDLRKRFGKVIYPETSEAGDNLFGKLEAKDSDWNREGAMIEIDLLKKSAQKDFIGVKKDDRIEFDPRKVFEDDRNVEVLLDGANDLKGKVVLTVQTISRIEPAAMGQDLFDRVFGKGAADSEEAFRKKIHDTISENYQRETNHFLEHSIEDELVKQTKINIPEEFLKTWLKATDEENKITDEVLEKEFNDYVRSLKWDLIRNKIAEDNNITVETEQVRDRARDLVVSQFGGPVFAEQIKDRLDGIVDNYLSNENGRNFMRLYNQIRNERVFTIIKEKISIVEKKVDLEEFRKIVETHTH